MKKVNPERLRTVGCMYATLLKGQNYRNGEYVSDLKS